MSAADGDSDFTEEHVKIMLNRSPWNSKLHSWVQCGSGKIASVRMNWVTFVFAVIILFGFSIVAMVDPGAGGYFGSGKAWVAQNFTWMYIRELLARRIQIASARLQPSSNSSPSLSSAR